MFDLKKMKKMHLQAGVLLGTLLIYLIVQIIFGSGPLNFLPPIIGAIVVIEIFVFVGMEIKTGAIKHGWKHEVLDTLIALIVAVCIWYGASFILNTETPISGVVSCSMLPNLQRGDFVLVHGAPITAYEIEMTKEELESLNDRAEVTYGNKSATIKGSIFSYCVFNRHTDMCQAFVNSPGEFVEEKGVFTYLYDRCPLTYSNDTQVSQPCVTSVIFKGQEYLTNFSNDIMIYNPPKTDYYSLIGDIVHRTMFKINVDDKSYHITRGDNNPILDLQVYNYQNDLENRPVPEENVRGKVILRIPILGYFKLFLSGYLQEDPQCRTQLEFPTAG
jgi:signal peptidase I